MSRMDDRSRELLMERARELAARAQTRERTAVGELVALVRVGGEQMALPASAVRGVLRAPAITPVPGLPAWMPGLVQLRSRILSVVDPTLLFGLSADTTRNYLTLLEYERRPLGLLVVEVAGVRQIYADEIVEQSNVTLGEGAMPVSFTTRDLTTVLDIERLFALADLRSDATGKAPLPLSPGGSP